MVLKAGEFLPARVVVAPGIDEAAILEELAVRTAHLHRALLPVALAVLPVQKELDPRGRAVQLGRRHVHVSDDREEPILVLGNEGR